MVDSKQTLRGGGRGLARRRVVQHGQWRAGWMSAKGWVHDAVQRWNERTAGQSCGKRPAGERWAATRATGDEEAADDRLDSSSSSSSSGGAEGGIRFID